MSPVNKKRRLPRIAFAAFFVGLGVVLSLGVLITLGGNLLRCSGPQEHLLRAVEARTK